MILVTGGAGFIGANFVLDWLAATGEPVVNLDKLTYAGNLDNLALARGRPPPRVRARRHRRRDAVTALLREHRPRAIVNFAAESHVDRSIDGPAAFVRDERRRRRSTCSRRRARTWTALPDAGARALPLPARVDRRSLRLARAADGRVLRDDALRAELARTRRSKAASDHLVRAYHHTYGLPTLMTNCSNNYGPFQFPEKLIPLMILNALARQAAARLRRRPATSATGSTSRTIARRIRAVLARGRAGRDVQHRRQCRANEHRRRAHAVRALDELAPSGRGSRTTRR